MDPITQQTVLAAAGAAGGDPVYVDDVFSTFLYEGTGQPKTIKNEIELGSNVGVSLTGKTITDTSGSADYSALINGVFSSTNSDYYYGSIDCYIDYGSAVVSTFYDLAPQGDSSTGAVYNTPTRIIGYGSNDASNWTSLGTVNFTTSDWSEGKFTRYNFPTNTTAYRYYRLMSPVGSTSLQEWRLGITDSALGKGGLVWIKRRDGSQHNALADTERGVNNTLISNGTGASSSSTTRVTSANSTGFSLGTDFDVNGNNQTYVSWTFRKQKGFFDVVTFTKLSGTQGISHSLGSVPGMIIIKNLDISERWYVYHRSLISNQYYLRLDEPDSQTPSPNLFSQAPTSTSFVVGSALTTGSNYVAYIFAHDDAQFGTDEDESIIKCGQFEANPGTAVNLGFEPQWVIVKRIDGVRDWFVIDNMRGMSGSADQNSQTLRTNNSNGESDNRNIFLTSTGFTVSTSSAFNTDTHIYMAIRRPHKPLDAFDPPLDATDVFAIDTFGGTSPSPPAYNSGFPVDMAMFRKTSINNWELSSRLTQGKYLLPATTTNEGTDNNYKFDYQNGFYNGSGSDSIKYGWMFKRAPGFFDVVAYSGFLSQGATGTIPHNLTVAPELIIFKNRSYGSGYAWYVWTAYSSNTTFLKLNENAAPTNFGAAWAGGDANNINISYGHIATSQTGHSYVAFLFATLPGISKVGSYSGTGSTLNIDCGFTNGARFVLIKRTDSGGNWFVLDTLRGIVAGNDPLFELNSYSAQDSNYDNLDPYNQGFTVTAYGGSSPYLNVSGGTYIFLAIA